MAPPQDWLLEIGTEELPPRSLQPLSEALREGVCEGLRKERLDYHSAASFCSPRRLAVLVEGLATRQADTVVERRGPTWEAAFDNAGVATKAAVGFARSCGTEVNRLQRVQTPKGAWLAYRCTERGRPAAELLPAIAGAALRTLPVAKPMRWGSAAVEFVRPVHWVVMLLGGTVVEAELLGQRAGRETVGHRFLHPHRVELATAREYCERLRDVGRVMVDFDARRERIRQQVVAAAAGLGAQARIDPALLDEVTALVEWPAALAGHFEQRFLELPPEILISVMQRHQKYFPVADAQGRLLPHFITVSNIESKDPDAVRRGNERVIRPRLADAAFFWHQDRKVPLAERIDGLERVLFEERLGTLREKAARVAGLAGRIAGAIGGDPQAAMRAALLAKCDLLTEVVGEFPELQGTIGRYYARLDGEPEEVAEALAEQYAPRFAGDTLAQTPTGQALSVADRIDTLVGIFGIGQRPDGERDPFALRRAALGVLRTLIECELDVNLVELLRHAQALLGGRVQEADTDAAVLAFMMDRLRGYYLDRGVRPDLFEAVLATQPTRPRDFDRRIAAISEFLQVPAAAHLAATNKRIGNILRKAGQAGERSVHTTLLQQPAEKELHDRVQQLQAETATLLAAGEYGQALRQVAQLQGPVDRFFDEVMVMVENADLRQNRLALLRTLADLFSGVADVSKLQG